jgi:hypothetical protein
MKNQTPARNQIVAAMLPCIGMILSIALAVHGQSYTGLPVTKERLVRTVKSKQFSVPLIVGQIKKSGVDFELTTSIEAELSSAGAHAQIVDAVRTNYRYKASGTRTPPKPEVDVAGEKYEALFYRSVEALNTLRSATSVQQATAFSKNVFDLGTKAIAADPSRPEAYTIVGAAHMFLRNFTEAERYGQMALDRGGNLAFPVYHLSGQPHPEMLYVGSGYVTVESAQKNFQYYGKDIRNLRVEQNYFTGSGYVAAFSISTNKAGQSEVWYFSPGMTGTPEEAQLILNLISKNSTK